jgi:hypothetical protein
MTVLDSMTHKLAKAGIRGFSNLKHDASLFYAVTGSSPPELDDARVRQSNVLLLNLHKCSDMDLRHTNNTHCTNL